jgi:hypothetical protein
MKLKSATLSAVAYTCAILTSEALAQSVQRPPSVPLVTADPYFSIWSNADTLTAKPTTHWTGKSHRLTSLVRIDGQALRIMGDLPADMPAMKQTAVSVMPTQTVYEFEERGVKVTLTFTTPLLPHDLNVLSRPVTYLTWTVQSTDGKAHEASIYFDAAAELAVHSTDQRVIVGRETVGSLNVLRVGSEDQPVLGASGDDRRIDWGHLYVAADSAGSSAAIAPAAAARGAFAKGAALPADAAGTPVPAAEAAALAVALPVGKVSSEPVSRHVTLAYDDEVSIKYFREKLRPFWRKDGATATDLLTTAEKDYESLLERCSAFDAELMADLRKAGGDSYVQLGVLAWRQALAAQKVCADENGQPLSFSKENFSNGCIATVDVLYPASPQMLVFAPSLLKASLVPLLDYSASPLWKHDSAPHDLGTYPIAVGQVYGGETTSPMPVEESGNMLIMIAALAKVEGNAEFARKYWPVLTTWSNYLKKNGLDPANQLTTDDFAGHIARNSNLSVKAIMGIASYATLADMLGKDAEAKSSMATARDYARKWMALAEEGDHYKLVFGDAGNGTWSQKYNLVWDRLLDLNVFPPEVVEKELAYYRTKMNTYGLPLDSRRAYTKLDWQLWTASMATDGEDFQRIVDACAKWANETPARVPLSDWYETDNGKQSGFQARSVVGGLFIGLMRDKATWKKYASRDTLKPGEWAELPWKMPPMRKLVAAADTAPVIWNYTTSAPDEKWMTASFDDTGWKKGRSGFGTKVTPGAIVHTEWDTDDIYLRREFVLPEGTLHDPQVFIHHDDDVEVYVNGVLATRASGFKTSYQIIPLSPAARAALRPGRNLMAVHCRQKGGGQYIDVGLTDLLPVPRK